MVTRPCGRWLLRKELEQKGILQKDITKACEEAYRESSEKEIARTLARKKSKSLGSLESPVVKKRITDFLVRRGFHWDLINEIFEEWDDFS